MTILYTSVPTTNSSATPSSPAVHTSCSTTLSPKVYPAVQTFPSLVREKSTKYKTRGYRQRTRPSVTNSTDEREKQNPTQRDTRIKPTSKSLAMKKRGAAPCSHVALSLRSISATSASMPSSPPRSGKSSELPIFRFLVPLTGTAWYWEARLESISMPGADGNAF